MVFCNRLRKKPESAHKCTIKRDESLSFLPQLPRRASIFQRFVRAFKKSTLISDQNPQSTEYFRSTAEILRVRKAHVEANSCIIHPFSKFRGYYEMWMVLIWLLVILYMPADATFNFFSSEDALQEHEYEYYENEDEFEFYYEDELEYSFKEDYISLALRIFCLVDIVITFFTGYTIQRKRKVVMNPWKIAKNYVGSIYFVTDVLASFPLEFVVNISHSGKALVALGFLRIIRLPTLNLYVTRSLDLLGIKSIYASIVQNVVVNFLVFHWFACFQSMIPQMRHYFYGGILAESWLERAGVPELDFVSRYVISFYRAVGGLFCITFERHDIEVWEEKLLQIVIFIFGKVYVLYLTVLVLHYLLRQRSLEIKYFEIISQVQAYMTQKQLPMAMQARLLHFYDYKYRKKFFKERSMTSLLSDKLKGEINLNVCSKLVQNVEFLAKLPQQQLQQIVINLKLEIYLANDIIIKAGSVGDCMYFLSSGTVGVWTPSGKEVCHLQDGAYFGEISLVFKDKRRTANIVAIEICEVYKLDRRAFRSCFKTNSQMFKLLEDVANERMAITEMFEDVHAKTFMELGKR